MRRIYNFFICTCPPLTKFILFILFLINLGFFSILPPIVEKDRLPYEVMMVRKSELCEFINDKVQQAKQQETKGAPYSPYDYFRDIDEIFKKQEELRVSTSIFNEIFVLREISFRNLGNIYTNEDVNNAKQMYNEHVDLELKKKNKTTLSKSTNMKDVLAWLLWLYLKTFPIALLLYGIWMEQDFREKHKKMLLRSPFSFLLALALYPIVISISIGMSLKDAGRRVFAEAELRSTRYKLFTLLSNDEISAIRDFAKSNLTISDWKNHLRAQGLIARHSFILALVATLFFMLIPKMGEAKQKRFTGFETMNTQLSIYAFENIRTCNNQDQGDDFKVFKTCKDLAVDIIKIFENNVSYLIPFPYFRRCYNQFYGEILHVPKVVRFKLVLLIV